MNIKILCCLLAIVGISLTAAKDGFSFEFFGTQVNSACAPAAPFNGDCMLCHTSGSKGEGTPAQTAYNQGGTGLTDFFCPPVASCTDFDNDTYAIEGGDCGPVDCDDTNSAINPGAAENCNDNLDNNCNGLVDMQDPAAVGCLICTDSDGDSFSAEGGDCGPVDCNDNDAAVNPDGFDIPNNGIDEDCTGADTVDPTILDNDGDSYTQADGDCDDSDASINPGATDIPNNGVDEDCDGFDAVDNSTIDNDGDGFTPASGDCDDTDGLIFPGAVENCTDSIDNDCNGLVDALDPNAANCPLNCTDLDGDTYAVDGGDCGPADCNDNDADINPGIEEFCDDGIDNDCDGLVDEGCDVTCPDADGDGYQDAACGGNDCNDNDMTINPGTAEVCGNGVDENCNGTSDDTCLTCPDGSLLVIKEMEYNAGDRKLKIKGRATAGSTISIVNADTNEILKDGINARKGKFETVVKNIDAGLKNIIVISSSGCAVDVAIDDKGDDEDDHEDDEDDEDEHDDEDDRDDRKKRWNKRH